MDDFGFWISPDGRVIDVHSTPPYTHHGHAMALGAHAGSHDPIRSLLEDGWVRVSLDVINVMGMTERKRAAIARFVASHPEAYNGDASVFVEDDLDETSTRVRWQDLL